MDKWYVHVICWVYDSTNIIIDVYHMDNWLIICRVSSQEMADL